MGQREEERTLPQGGSELGRSQGGNTILAVRRGGKACMGPQRRRRSEFWTLEKEEGFSSTWSQLLGLHPDAPPTAQGSRSTVDTLHRQ